MLCCYKDSSETSFEKLAKMAETMSALEDEMREALRLIQSADGNELGRLRAILSDIAAEYDSAISDTMIQIEVRTMEPEKPQACKIAFSQKKRRAQMARKPAQQAVQLRMI